MAACLMSSSTAAANGTAKFRVVGSEIAGEKGTVKIAWEYACHPGLTDTGKGVQFYLHTAPVTYPNGVNNNPIGTVDMAPGANNVVNAGMATLTFDAKKLGVSKGQKVTVVGRWSNNHQWGMGTDRPGGEFTLGQASQNSRLSRFARRALFMPRGIGQPRFRGVPLRAFRRAAGLKRDACRLRPPRRLRR